MPDDGLVGGNAGLRFGNTTVRQRFPAVRSSRPPCKKTADRDPMRDERSPLSAERPMVSAKARQCIAARAGRSCPVGVIRTDRYTTGVRSMSASPRRRTNSGQSRYVRLVPKPDLCSAAEDVRGCSAVFDRPRLRALTASVKTQGCFTAIKGRADAVSGLGCARIRLPTRAGRCLIPFGHVRVRCPW